MGWSSVDQVLENVDILFMQFENAKLKYATNARSTHTKKDMFSAPSIDLGSIASNFYIFSEPAIHRDVASTRTRPSSPRMRPCNSHFLPSRLCILASTMSTPGDSAGLR
ncbi:hypothetical protein NLG97_g2612 [Lecanicillium saksenae]|uniref:Uncharacterized protein n=1 Tax=Lecanicillium saksenae TaxID=468837 RepID=A0ACC1R0D2_9HYPO|nr:hypothetical protein NLG97_g2612 [Lecanicillium saksenae]